MVGQAVQVIHRVRYLTVQGATESNSELSLRTIAEEMKELKEQLYEVANSQFNGKYIFNGHRTDQAPYPDHDYQQAQLGTGEIKYEVARGVEITINQLAEEIFGPAGDPDDPDNDNLFAILDRIITALEAADPEAVGRELGALDRRMDIILERWAEIGARYNRLELMNNRMQDENLNLKTVLSKTEDADLAEVIIRLRTEENIYRSSLAAGARIIQPSLIDFLR